ncbi:MAG: hypothetical protein OQK82_03965 [Candidatus Pacearchaeota archaeon]|nr:hypothetical protein [Candidatus Pacearchaeota archaeon]
MEEQFVGEPILFENTKDVEYLQGCVSINGTACPIKGIRIKDIFFIKFQGEKNESRRTRKN